MLALDELEAQLFESDATLPKISCFEVSMSAPPPPPPEPGTKFKD